MCSSSVRYSSSEAHVSTPEKRGRDERWKTLSTPVAQTSFNEQRRGDSNNISGHKSTVHASTQVCVLLPRYKHPGVCRLSLRPQPCERARWGPRDRTGALPPRRHASHDDRIMAAALLTSDACNRALRPRFPIIGHARRTGGDAVVPAHLASSRCFGFCKRNPGSTPTTQARAHGAPVPSREDEASVVVVEMGCFFPPLNLPRALPEILSPAHSREPTRRADNVHDGLRLRGPRKAGLGALRMHQRLHGWVGDIY